MDPKHTTTFTVHLHHIGPDGQARPGLLFDCFQDAASEQSARLGFSIRELMKRDLTWVVSRYRVKVHRYPRWQERIHVTTWRSPQKGHTAPREFAIVDADNCTIALARGMFILLNRATNQPVSPAEHFPGYPVTRETVFADDLEKLPGISSLETSTLIHVRRDDLDLNRHVNNSRVVTFALEGVPPSIAQTHLLDRIDVAYIASIRHQTCVRSNIQRIDMGQGATLVHLLAAEKGDAEYARLVTHWTMD